MPKETVYPIVIVALLLFCPGSSWASPAIRTTRATIVLDPGHGGSDSGITTTAGLSENQIALTLAKHLSALLSDRFEIRLTRSDDTRVPPGQRAAIANQNRADLFISLHLHGQSGNKGFAYFFDTPETETAEAHKSWKLQPLPYKLQSKHLARHIQAAFKAAGAHPIRVQSLPLLPLEGICAPAVVLEPFAISALPLQAGERDAFLFRMAEIISNGITDGFQSLTGIPARQH